MKKNDIAALILIVSIALIFAYFVANALIGDPQTNPVEVERVKQIQAQYPAPDSRIFGSGAIDPTVDINGQGGQSNQPFSE